MDLDISVVVVEKVAIKEVRDIEYAELLLPRNQKLTDSPLSPGYPGGPSFPG